MENLNPVIVFSLSTCTNCKDSVKLLEKYNVPYELTDVDMLEKKEQAHLIDDLKQFSPSVSFPTIIIGETVINGYKEKEIVRTLKIQNLIKDSAIRSFFTKYVKQKLSVNFLMG